MIMIYDNALRVLLVILLYYLLLNCASQLCVLFIFFFYRAEFYILLGLFFVNCFILLWKLEDTKGGNQK